MKKIRRDLWTIFLAGFVTIIFLLTFCLPVFAGEPKQERGYTYSLKQLMEQAEKNIKKVDEKLESQKREKENQKIELEAREYFQKGNALYKEGKLKEAKKEWQKALKITKDPQMKNYVRDNEKKARKKELARKKEQKEKQRKLKAEQREKERLEWERQKQLKLENKEKERQQKKEKREKEQSEKKRQRRLERQKKREEHRAKKSKETIQHAKEIVKTAKEEPMVKLGDLTYKTEKECLDILSEDPKNKEAYNNLVNLYVLKDELK